MTPEPELYPETSLIFPLLDEARAANMATCQSRNTEEEKTDLLYLTEPQFRTQQNLGTSLGQKTHLRGSDGHLERRLKRIVPERDSPYSVSLLSTNRKEGRYVTGSTHKDRLRLPLLLLPPAGRAC